MILKLSRARRHDTSLAGDDPVTRARKEFCGRDAPKIFTASCYDDDLEGEFAVKNTPLPELWVRQACNAQDPMSSCHHYLFFMRVVLPGIFLESVCVSRARTATAFLRITISQLRIQCEGHPALITLDATANSWVDMQAWLQQWCLQRSTRAKLPLTDMVLCRWQTCTIIAPWGILGT